jgi:phosphate/sulfate permease
MTEDKIYHWINADYFYKVLNWIIVANSISGIIAIIVILFLYKIWKKSSEANEIIYMKLKEFKNEKSERVQDGN